MLPGLILAVALAQDAPATPASAGSAELERIRRELAEPPAVALPSPRRDGLVFRVTVHGRQQDRPVWEEWSTVPSYVRPMAPTYHYEFLHQVTPEAFRSGTLFPAGIPIGQVIEFLAKRIDAGIGKRRESRARREVREALAEFLRARDIK